MLRQKNNSTGLVLALGGGGAPGLAHIGVLQVLAEQNIPVRAVAGTSIGAQIGAFLASGIPVSELAAIAQSFDWKKTVQLFFPDLPTGGLVSGSRIVEFLRKWIGNRQIEDLDVAFVAVATDLKSGDEVVIDQGDLVSAVRASVSIPGVVAPYQHHGRWLVDGAVVNPVPFDVARQRFGGPVLAVSVNSGGTNGADLLGQSPHASRQLREMLQKRIVPGGGLSAEMLQEPSSTSGVSADRRWTTRRVLDRVLSVAGGEIARLRASQNPPDLALSPATHDIGRVEFYRADEAIAAGRRAAEEFLPELLEMGGVSSKQKSIGHCVGCPG